MKSTAHDSDRRDLRAARQPRTCRRDHVGPRLRRAAGRDAGRGCAPGGRHAHRPRRLHGRVHPRPRRSVTSGSRPRCRNGSARAVRVMRSARRSRRSPPRAPVARWWRSRSGASHDAARAPDDARESQDDDRARPRGAELLSASTGARRARADPHLARLPRRTLRLQAQEGGPLSVPRLQHARAPPPLLRRGAPAEPPARRRGLSRRAAGRADARRRPRARRRRRARSSHVLRMRRLPADRMLPALLARGAVDAGDDGASRAADRRLPSRARRPGPRSPPTPAPRRSRARWDDTVRDARALRRHRAAAPRSTRMLADFGPRFVARARAAPARAPGRRPRPRRSRRPARRARLLRRRRRSPARATARRSRPASTSSTASSSRSPFRCNDVASEIAFLTMDLEHRGRRDLADAFAARLRGRRRRSDDRARCCRSTRRRARCVRATVECLKSAEAEVEPAARAAAAATRRAQYLALAVRCAWRAERSGRRSPARGSAAPASRRSRRGSRTATGFVLAPLRRDPQARRPRGRR